MEVKKTNGRWMPKGNFKRWWRFDWKAFFEAFINIDAVDRDCLPSLMGWRQKLLEFFETERMDEQIDKARLMLSKKITGNRRRTL